MMDYHYRTRIYRKKFVFETGEKKCNMCFEIKDIDDFYRQKDNRKGYYYHYYICKECWAIYLKKYRGSIGIEYKKEKILYTCSLCNNEFAEKEMIKLFNDDKFICVNCNPSNHIEESLQGIFV
jgi:hypothetical protein